MMYIVQTSLILLINVFTPGERGEGVNGHYGESVNGSPGERIHGHSGESMHKNVVVTACNSKYFKSCLTLITSLCKHSDKVIDFFYLFNLSLTENEHSVLMNLEKVELILMMEILEYTKCIRVKFPECLATNPFAWKS